MAETGIIDRYRIIRELGRGGMATVYLAHDPRFRRDVAIKVLPRQFTHDPRFLERFTQEAQLIAALEHPAIVPVHDFGEYADAPYLVMRYMAGGGLRQRLAGGPLPPAEIVRILDRLAPALDKAHARGVIHRDIKPDNVLFDEDDLPYLADFGIARMAEATQTMTIVGTPAYMSPEQVQGDVTLDARSDIYALGVVLYEMLSGRQPYKADTPTKQMLKHVLEPIPDVCAANPALPPACRALIERAMAKQPAARYQTAAELAAAVRDLAAPQAIKPAPVDLAALTVLDAAPERTGDGGQAAPPAEFKSPAITELESPPRAAGVEEPAQSALDTPPAIDTPPVRTPPSSTAQPPPPARAQPPGQTRAPAWGWWVGALALVVAAVWGLSALVSGGGTSARVAGSAVTPTREPTPAATPDPTNTPSPNLPPPNPALGSTWVRPVDGMTLVYVPGGTFPMGSTDGDSDEQPIHNVTLDGFWLDQTEVTNAQFSIFVDETDYVTTAEEAGGGYTYSSEGWDYTEGADWRHPRGPNSNLRGLDQHSVVLVSWEDANAYCAWAGGRLPTEAEWEYAARGPDAPVYPWGNTFDCRLVNADDETELDSYVVPGGEGCDGYVRTAPVGSFPDGASWVGALDMAGNVWEWVNDWYDSRYYANSPAENPRGPADGQYKALRGGAWLYLNQDVRAANRFSYDPSYTLSSVGFRCAQE